MGYGVAINKAWNDLLALNPAKNISTRFLTDEYSFDLDSRRVISLSFNIPAKDYTAILLLHYLVKKLKGLPELSSQWLDFKELSRIEGYQVAFRQRAIEPIIRKYGRNSEGLLSVLERLPAKKVAQGDIGIVLDVFEKVPVLVLFWRADEEFGPEANMLFDKSIADIFCIEDIVVLAQTIAHQL